MPSLRGRAQVSVDDKGRVSLPAKYRKLLPDELVLAKSPDTEFPALVLYTEEGFEHWIDNVMDSKGGYAANPRELDYINDDYYENSENVHVDGIGRIPIALHLREYAGIDAGDKDVVISGARDHLVMRRYDVWEANNQRRAQALVYDSSD